jgi:hypothetical protein
MSLSLMSHQFSLFLSPTSSRLEHPDYSSSASDFSLPVSTLIPDLTILEFISWTTNLRKQIE